MFRGVHSLSDSMSIGTDAEVDAGDPLTGETRIAYVRCRPRPFLRCEPGVGVTGVVG